ncbi:MAG TPA: trimethylamine methyltransferase family protein, partial [Terriglobia bacterium]|nr:trimethylamine methyltransferase family protein [Terriglobia bacterium]
LIADHTRRDLRKDITFPGPVINRANRARWTEEGKTTLRERARKEICRILAAYKPPRVAAETTLELTRLMEREAGRHGMDALPARA